MNPPILSKAKPGESLYLYIAAGERAVSSTLIREENGSQSPVYYVSQVLKDAETRYPNLEKFAPALVHSSRKLRQYFQGREIRVITNQLLRKIIHKPDASGRLVNWAIELSQFNIKFVPRTTIKAQALAKFVMECTFSEVPETPKLQSEEEKETSDRNSWTLYVDGSATAERSGAGLILSSPDGFTIQQVITFAFKVINNQAEYEALLSGLRLAKSLRVRCLIIYSDSQIVVRQTSDEYIAKDPKLARYQEMVRAILETIPNPTILQINREENTKADELSKLVHNTSDLSSSVYFEELGAPSTDRPEVLCIRSPHNWMTPYIAYFKDGTLPEDQNKARYLKYKAARFFLEDNQLYRRTFSAPTLKCVDPDEADYCLREVHEGICGDHLAAKALAYKVIRQGYYCPTIHTDSVPYVKKCSKCQKFSNVPKLEECKKSWPDELPKVFWSYRTTSRTGTGETPFKLAYDTEARLPIETGSPSHRVVNFDEVSNIEGLRTNLELLDEVRDQAVEKMERYKEKTKLYFAKKAKIKEYVVGDLVLRDIEASDPTNQGKLQPNWEGPYIVKEVLRPGTYKLNYLSGTEVPNTWHGTRLRKFYQ
ncbi:uncharacterized protein LOC141673957 [Apium graveolens]|uniref:uncharacterized protein LOC141673957 n=1 Tax=Apium graveolens TaxID=4045 RepID=UPI003D7BBA9D